MHKGYHVGVKGRDNIAYPEVYEGDSKAIRDRQKAVCELGSNSGNAAPNGGAWGSKQLCSFYNMGCCQHETPFCIHVVSGQRRMKWHLCNLKVPKVYEGETHFKVCGGEHMPYDCPYWERAFHRASRYAEFAHRYRMEAADGFSDGEYCEDRGLAVDLEHAYYVAIGDTGPLAPTQEELDTAPATWQSHPATSIARKNERLRQAAEKREWRR